MLTFNYHQLHVLDYPIFKLTFVLSYKTKKEPATETNPQQALGFIQYGYCPFVINISGVHLHTLPTKINIVFLITKKNNRQLTPVIVIESYSLIDI